MNRSPISRWRWVTWAAIAIHFSTFLLLGLFRHWGYLSSLNDLGVFDQAIWSTLHGEFLLNTSNLNQPINWLGFHFNPVLLLFVPFYALSPSVEWFVLAQAAALSLAAWPIFLLASRVCQSGKAGLLWALIYLVNPFLLNAAAWDFHPVTLAVPFIALGLLAVEKADSRLLFLSCLPLLLIQEHLGLSVAGFGVLWWLRNKDWKTAVSLISLGTAHAALVLGVIMPAFSPTGSHLMLGSGPDQLSRYGWLGHSISEAAQTLLTHPLAVIQALILQTDGASYLGLLLLPFLGFPLAGSAFLLPGLPDLLANMLSANPMPRSLFAYHSVTLVPVLTAAAIYGTRRFALRFNKYTLTQLAGLVATVNFATGYIFAPLPLPGAHNIWMPTHFINWPDPSVQTIRAAVGSNASASVQGNIGTHFSQRRDIYLYPNKVGKAETIILRLESPTTRLLPPDPSMVSTLAGHLQMSPTDYLASIHCLLASKTYGVLIWEAPWLIFAKGAPKGETEREIETRLMRLREQWGLGPKEETQTPAECKG